jgi:multiple sugar transport system permease protein
MKVLRMRVRRMAARIDRNETLLGYLFASPFLIGFFGLTLIPVLLSIYYSFCRYDVLRPPMWVGLDNYRFLFLESTRFWTSAWNTAYYTALRLPLVIIGSLLLAMLVAKPVRGVGIVRTIYYMPSIITGVALSVIWLWMYNPQYGLINRGLALIGVPGPAWLEDPRFAKEAIILMGLWSLGGGRMIIFIAGLNSIPRHLYESAELDGAGWWSRFVHVTLPQLGGVLFLLTIIEIIFSFQVFTEAYLMTRGGPGDATLFYNLELYFKAFQDFDMGMASAMAWLLFVVTLLITVILFQTVGKRIYYEGER